MIKANFDAYDSYVTDSLYQWDLNQVLTVTGLNLATAPEIHFHNANMGRAIVRQSTMVNHVVSVPIPNSLLQEPLTIKVDIGIYEDDIFKIIEKVSIPVKPKLRPSDYQIQDTDEEIYSFKKIENKLANSLIELEKANAETNQALNARVDNIIAHNNDTEGNTELVDIRIGLDGTTYNSAGDAVRNVEKRTEVLKNLLAMESTICVDSFNLENAIVSVPASAPFILPVDDYNYKDCVIERIKLNIRTIGTVSIGYTTRIFARGDTYSDADFIVVDTLTATKHGEQTLALNTPFIVPDNGMLFIGWPTDTGNFLYGMIGTNKNFLYNSNGTYMSTTNSIGMNVIGTKVPKKSAYHGKTLSILGDSISTYDGYIPSENATYYPNATVNAVEKTWWYKLLTALNMELKVNNSWSGSRVTTTNGENSAGCMSRCEDLGDNPDVIIVWLGINDFNNEVALGEYDGTASIPTNTTIFTNAYAIMLDKILTKYKTSEVWVCTLSQCERNNPTVFPEVNGNGVALSQFNKAIKELAEAFGVKVLDHNKSGLTYHNMSVYDPDKLHPNANGHSLIANNDIRQMDPTVKTRY